MTYWAEAGRAIGFGLRADAGFVDIIEHPTGSPGHATGALQLLPT